MSNAIKNQLLFPFLPLGGWQREAGLPQVTTFYKKYLKYSGSIIYFSKTADDKHKND